METIINFIPIDYDYFDYEGKTYSRVYGRNDHGKRVCVIDSFDVYFYAILKSGVSEKKIKAIQKEIEKIVVQKETRVSRVIKTEIVEKNFLGKPVKAIKIYITNFKDAHAIADKIDFPEIIKRREYDLPYITKYIIERNLKPLCWHKIKGEILNNSLEFQGLDNHLDVDLCILCHEISEVKEKLEFKPRILAYDIETDDFEIGKGQIVMISLVGDNFKKVLTWKQDSLKHYVENYRDEATMIEKFLEYVKKYSPDILVGYYSDGFDLPYLRARARKNQVKLSLSLDHTQPILSRGNVLTAKIKGIVHLDMLKFIRVAYSQYLQSETLSLNDVSQELLGEKKTDFQYKHSSKILSHEWEDYFEYNLQDSILTYKLAEKAWPDLLEFSRVIQEPLFDISRDGMSSNVENYIIHNLSKYNEIVEKRPVSDEIVERRTREKYEGAFVLQPKPGLYENICFFDFTSYWPSIIVTFNLSKSTMLDKKASNAIEVELSDKRVYFSKTPGFFPEMLKEIIEKRKEYKKEYAKDPNPFTKARSNAFKLLANASYGYQGFFGARYYCPEASASATAISRDFTKKTIEEINKQGYEVTYSDTDSVSFQLLHHTKKEVLELLEEINSHLPGIMELDLEDFYKRGIWVTKRTGEFGAKKKYALIDEKGKMKIRGFETVRRDWCELARVTQNNVLQFILEDGNDKRALNYVKEIIKKLKRREIQLKELIIRTQLKKSIEEYKSESPHVTIAKKMREKGLPVDIGMLMEYYISESGSKKSLIRERAKLPDEKGEYDINYYLKNQILPAVENIFEVFKVNVEELTEGKKQTSLDSF